jgi:hypothetical protein
LLLLALLHRCRPRGTPKKRGCKLQSYTWKKLCVPKVSSAALSVRLGRRNASYQRPRASPYRLLDSCSWALGPKPTLQSGARGAFRAKVQLKTKCGTMIVKYRISASGQALTWGRSKT